MIDFTRPVIIYSAVNSFKDKPGGFVWSGLTERILL